jgi:hypothetical protein
MKYYIGLDFSIFYIYPETFNPLSTFHIILCHYINPSLKLTNLPLESMSLVTSSGA